VGLVGPLAPALVADLSAIQGVDDSRRCGATKSAPVNATPTEIASHNFISRGGENTSEVVVEVHDAELSVGRPQVDRDVEAGRWVFVPRCVLGVGHVGPLASESASMASSLVRSSETRTLAEMGMLVHGFPS